MKLPGRLATLAAPAPTVYARSSYSAARAGQRVQDAGPQLKPIALGRMALFRTFAPFTAIAILSVSPSGAQTPSHASIERRLRQALWPETMFDSRGQPEPSQILNSWRGDPSQSLNIRLISDEELPGVRFYSASAFRCFDCHELPVAVIETDSLVMTLLRPEDLAQALERFVPDIAHGDTARLRTATLALLRGTCILGCSPHLLRSARDLTASERQMFRLNGGSTPPAIDPPSAGVVQDQTVVGFAVATQAAVWRVAVTRYPRDYHVSARAIVSLILSP